MYRQKKILAMIPARGGSKEIPGKNLCHVGGLSLLARAIRSAKQSRHIDRLIVSSDDDEILNEARIHECEVPFIRPAELAQDATPGVDPVLHAIETLPGYDYVVLLQPTSPFRAASDIDAAIEHCVDSDAPFCVSVSEAKHHPQWCFHVDESTHLHPVLPEASAVPRQALNRVVALNGAVYVANTQALLHHKTFLTEQTVVSDMPIERSLDIDSPYDLWVAQTLSSAPALHHETIGG